MIQVNGLTKDYGARRAIDNLTFDAEQGEIVGFLGPNGAGKTTTMRILTGYMPPTDGTAIVAGYDVVEESLEVRKRVGYLPETVPLYTDMTALEYLKFMADLRKIPNSEERAYETLERVNLGDRANSFIGNFSKGLPHNNDGTVVLSAYNALVNAINSGRAADFDAIPLGGTRGLTNPQSGLAFDMQGPDAHALVQPPAPAFASREQAAEISENYWMALLRDVPYSQYSTNPIANPPAGCGR